MFTLADNPSDSLLMLSQSLVVSVNMSIHPSVGSFFRHSTYEAIR